MSELTTREWAEIHAGEIVDISTECVDPPDGVHYEARVVGYRLNDGNFLNRGDVIVEPTNGRGWTIDLDDDSKEFLPVDPKPKKGWYVDRIYLTPRVQKSKAQGTGTSKRVIPPWPHTCPACKGPALHMSNMIDCKNRCRPQYTYR